MIEPCTCPTLPTHAWVCGRPGAALAQLSIVLARLGMALAQLGLALAHGVRPPAPGLSSRASPTEPPPFSPPSCPAALVGVERGGRESQFIWRRPCPKHQCKRRGQRRGDRSGVERRCSPLDARCSLRRGFGAAHAAGQPLLEQACHTTASPCASRSPFSHNVQCSRGFPLLAPSLYAQPANHPPPICPLASRSTGRACVCLTLVIVRPHALRGPGLLGELISLCHSHSLRIFWRPWCCCRCCHGLPTGEHPQDSLWRCLWDCVLTVPAASECSIPSSVCRPGGRARCFARYTCHRRLLASVRHWRCCAHGDIPIEQEDQSQVPLLHNPLRYVHLLPRFGRAHG